MKLTTQKITDRAQWNNTLALLPFSHVLQTWEWGEFKAGTTGWVPERIAFLHNGDVVAMAQILARKELGFTILYVPKGPALDYEDRDLRKAVLEKLKSYAREAGAIFIKIDPDIPVGWGVPGEEDELDDRLGIKIADEWRYEGLIFSTDQIQFRNSVVLDLRKSEEELMKAMKQKTRYNVRLGPEKKNLTIRFGGSDDLDMLYELYTETAIRDEFIIRPLDYYRKAWGAFMDAGLAQPIIAEYQGEPLAHVIIFGFGPRAWYFYGASSNRERRRMPNYALQWAAIQWAKAQGMTVYDFWGAPDDFNNPDDPLAGVFRFKDGFGGIAARRIGAWDFPVNKTTYKLYTRLMPVALSVMKFFGRLRLRGKQG